MSDAQNILVGRCGVGSEHPVVRTWRGDATLPAAPMLSVVCAAGSATGESALAMVTWKWSPRLRSTKRIVLTGAKRLEA